MIALSTSYTAIYITLPRTTAQTSQDHPSSSGAFTETASPTQASETLGLSFRGTIQPVPPSQPPHTSLFQCTERDTKHSHMHSVAELPLLGAPQHPGMGLRRETTQCAHPAPTLCQGPAEIRESSAGNGRWAHPCWDPAPGSTEWGPLSCPAPSQGSVTGRGSERSSSCQQGGESQEEPIPAGQGVQIPPARAEMETGRSRTCTGAGQREITSRTPAAAAESCLCWATPEREAGWHHR